MSDARCATCAFWKEPEKYPAQSAIDQLQVTDPVTYERVKPQPFEVRHCTAARDNERPAEDGAATMDGSGYFSGLFTGPRFGCVLHEPRA